VIPALAMLPLGAGVIDPQTPEKRESGEGDECTFAASLNIALRTTRFTFD